MEKINLITVDAQTRAYIKKQVVHLYKKGKKHSEISDALCISYDAVSRIVRSYNKNGHIVKEQTRGRKRGEKEHCPWNRKRKFNASSSTSTRIK